MNIKANEGGDDSTADDVSINIVTDFDSRRNGGSIVQFPAWTLNHLSKTSHMMDTAVLVPTEIGIAKPYAVL